MQNGFCFRARQSLQKRLAEQALVVDAVPLSVVPPTTLTIVSWTRGSALG